MQADDVIVKIGDTEVSGQGDLERALTLNYKPGETVPVTVIRGGSQQTLQVTLGTRPPR
jgi:S1-C subfamily serine protease